ncbi:hypothetical protein SF1_18940 [Sphingobacterium faecium NBRC 15299]|uniref:hypothetical protein n=1 Tax=Sphingobacterium faecium TaxID=34087 RepID=UPI000D3C4619|nr:hypothetical protein [Sphingobacterium faecium]PTX09465.1 hypothetical protein C8N37_10693 [Sphingobacterium faecium]GEM63912.1 hypothetical protein SF1_18940 [Sphingobacterium faecium NBRC 15299]
MKKFIKLFAMPSLLLTFWATLNLKAQDTAKTSAFQTIEKSELEKEKVRYTKTFDSLLLEERYRNIIEYGELLILDRESEISQLPIPYLICAYHFIGNEERSKKLLNQKLRHYNYEDLVRLLITSDIAFIKYFSVKKNREPIITKAINDYKKNEKASDKAAGEQIIRFFINDQLIRKLKYIYKEDDPVYQDKRFQEFKKQDSIQNVNILAFYKQHKKYFSSEEVGKTVSWYQPIILSHYDNIQLRQTFFKELLEKAVKEGRMEKTSYVHFLLRTESFTNPDFFKNLEKRMEEVRKEFDLPNYLWNPF